MLAALMIERRGVPLEHAAEISIARFGISGPEGLWKQLIGRGTMGKSTRILLMLLLLTSFASQLTSTLLLTDLLDRPIVTIPHTSLLGVGFQDIDSGGNPKAIPISYKYTFNYVKWKPNSFETFAEHNVPPIFRDGLDDTGVSLRAFLPISSQPTRENIQEYRGMARVFDARAACVRPNLANLR